MSVSYTALLAVFLVSAASPLLVGLMPPRARLPQVVLLLAGGVVIGPSMLDWGTPADVTVLSDLGLGFLFLLAGYELDPQIFREPAGRLAGLSWATSLLLGAVLVTTLAALGEGHSIVAATIALTTTALGVLLPILREAAVLHSPLGRQVLSAGAIGELAPIVGIALLLGSRNTRAAAVLLLLFVVASVALAYAPTRINLPRITEVVRRSEHETGQSTLRLTVAMLVALLAAASGLGFDAVLGAFLAGMVLRHWVPGDVDRLEEKLDIVAWGVFVPIFFVSSGMGLDVDSMARRPLLPIMLLVIMLLVRGGPALFLYRHALPVRGRLQLALFTATTLPLLIALTQIAVKDGSMSSSVAAAMVGAGAVSVLVFPKLAVTIGSNRAGT